MYLTVIAFKNGKQQFIRLDGEISNYDLEPKSIQRWKDVSTGAVIVFNADDVLYLSQVEEKEEQIED